MHQVVLHICVSSSWLNAHIQNSDHEFCHSHMMAMMMMMMMLDRHTLICSVCSFYLCEGTEFIINVGILPDTSCSTTTRGNDQSVHGTFISVLLFLLPCWNFPLLLPFCHLSLAFSLLIFNNVSMAADNSL